MDPPRLSVFSTPLISTFVLDETHRVLFDAGDGVTALLEGKIHKAQVVALSHAHRDHIAGLPQLLNLRGAVAASNGDPLRVLHPEGSGSFLAISRFLSHFDQATSGKVRWQPVRPGDAVEMESRRFLRAYATRHIPAPELDRPRSLGYQIVRTVDRVKPELRGLPQSELDQLRQAGGREAITHSEEEVLLTVSGDTQALPAAALCGTRFLLHECTFLDSDHDLCDEARERGHDHACLGDVLHMAVEAGVEHLALYHISKRYSDDEIVRSVRADCARIDVRFPVSVALPGRLYHDLFSQTIWKGEREQD
jgi:ribonuclease Z